MTYISHPQNRDNNSAHIDCHKKYIHCYIKSLTSILTTFQMPSKFIGMMNVVIGNDLQEYSYVSAVPHLTNT